MLSNWLKTLSAIIYIFFPNGRSVAAQTVAAPTHPKWINFIYIYMFMCHAMLKKEMFALV